MVEGRAFMIKFYPKGNKSGKNTHISVFISRKDINKYMKLDLD